MFTAFAVVQAMLKKNYSSDYKEKLTSAYSNSSDHKHGNFENHQNFTNHHKLSDKDDLENSGKHFIKT